MQYSGTGLSGRWIFFFCGRHKTMPAMTVECAPLKQDWTGLGGPSVHLVLPICLVDKRLFGHMWQILFHKHYHSCSLKGHATRWNSLESSPTSCSGRHIAMVWYNLNRQFARKYLKCSPSKCLKSRHILWHLLWHLQVCKQVEMLTDYFQNFWKPKSVQNVLVACESASRVSLG